MSAGMACCPYIAGPTCDGCDGGCWEPAPPRQPEPQLCEWCSRWTGAMQECDGTCRTITEEQWHAAYAVDRYAADPEGRALVQAIHDRKADA